VGYAPGRCVLGALHSGAVANHLLRCLHNIAQCLHHLVGAAVVLDGHGTTGLTKSVKLPYS